MKRSILFFCLLLVSSMMFSQTVVFSEDFEGATFDVTSSSTGSTGWALTNTYTANGTYADSATVAIGDTMYLTTNSFSTLNNTYVEFEFNHIAKVSLFDAANVEVSTDGGANWTKLTGSQYLPVTGSGSQFGSSNKFTAATYPLLWEAIYADSMDNNWFRTEVFNLSSLAANQNSVMVRLALYSVGTQAGYYGWIVDDLKVTMAPSELIPPIISMISPIVQGTVYSSGPFEIKANITDGSGIDTAMLIYTVSTGFSDTLGMTIISPDTFSADIPFYGFGKTIQYRIEAYDLSTAHNVDLTSTYSFYCKYSNGGTFVIGTATTSNTATGYPSPYTNYYGGTKHQMLIKASELTAAGVTPGQMKSIAFDVASVGSSFTGTLIDFQIDVGHTMSTTVNSSSFIGSLTNVLSAGNTPIVVGINTHVLGTPFVWDGTSNIVIQTSYSNSNSGAAADGIIMYNSNSGFLSTNWYRADNATPNAVLTSTTVTGSGNIRPNMILVFEVPSNLTNDIGVNAITYPTGGVLANVKFPVNVTLKNFGVDTTTTAQIKWELDGIAKTNYTWSGQLLPDSVSVPIELDSIILISGNHQIKVWSVNPNGTSDFNTGNDTSVIDFYACSNLLSGNYTIGGTNPDFIDFASALIALDQCGINGPVTFNVASGTYNEQIELPFVSGSSTTNTILFKSASGDSSTVILTYDASPATDNFTLNLNGISNVTFKDMTFSATDSTLNKVVQIGNGATNVHFLNNRFIGISNGTVIDSDGALIHTIDSLGNNITVLNNAFVNGSIAINIDGGPGINSTGYQIKNNTISNCLTTGISVANAVSPQIDHNSINSILNSASFTGIACTECNVTPQIIKNNIISRNTQIANGIRLTSSNGDSLNPGLIANNFVLVNGNSIATTITAGILNNESKNLNYYYNSVNITGNQTNAVSMCLFDAGVGISSNINVVNNIFSNEANGYSYYVTGVDTSAFFVNYNDIYNPGSGTFAFLGAAVADFAAWKTATAEENNSITTNPYFSSAVDLHSTNNLLNATGTPIAGITMDIDGDVRNVSTPDIGADEFNPSPYDMATLEILSPMSDCALGTNEIVKIRIRNVGSADVTTAFNAKFQMNSNTIVSENITSSILSGDTLDYTFAAKVDLDVFTLMRDSTFEFKAWVDLTTDPVQYNDTAYASVLSGYKPAAPVVADTTIAYGDSVTITAQHIDSNFYWFAYDTSSVELYNGKYFATPVLYDTTTYWVEAGATGSGAFIISEISHYKTTTGTPSSGWPLYHLTDDYIEITGAPNSDLGGFILEQWNTALANTFTFPAGTKLSPNGTAIIAVGQPNASVPSPADFYYHGVTTQLWSSTTAVGRILKNSKGDIVDAVGVNGFTFPTSANVPASDWSGSPTGGGSTCGFRLIGVDDNTGANWIVSSAINPQDPNIFNNGVVAPTGGSCPSDRVPLTVNVSGIPTGDIGISSITTNSGCALTTTEQVTIGIYSQGIVPVNGTVTASFRVDSNAYVTTESVPNIINPGDTIYYTFASTANLLAFPNDTAYDITAWVYNSVGDPYQVNDTLILDSTISHFTPVAPIVSNILIPYATPVTLTAQSIDSLAWYAFDTSSVALAITSTYTTPILYDTTTYWVEAGVSGSGGFIISEISHFKTTTGVPSGGWPTYLTTDDYIEITGPPNSDLEGYTLEQWNTALANTFTFPAGTKLSPNGTAIIAVGQPNASVPSPADFYYHGVTTQLWSSTTAVGRILKNSKGDIVDAVGVNGFTFPTSANVPASDWSGSPTGGGSTCGFRLIGVDDNTGTNWVVSSAINPQDPNILNTGVVAPIAAGCASQRVPLIVNVTAPPQFDAGVKSIHTPISGANLTNSEIVQVMVRNTGIVSIDHFALAYVIDNLPPVIDTFTNVLHSGDSTLFTFAVPADMYTYKVYNIKSYTMLPLDTTYLNDTSFVQVENSMHTYCPSNATSTSYHDIENVTFANINNTSIAPFDAMYTDYTNTTPALIAPTNTYPISIDINSASTFAYDGYVEVYIDYNRDGVYSEPSELAFGGAFTQASSTTPANVSGNVVVPVSALPGLTQMRVVAVYTGTAASVVPCGTYLYGETEDYVCMIAPLIPNDAGVTEFILPGVTSNEGALIPVEVVVKNFGTDTLTSMSIEYSVNNGTAVPYTYSGSIAPNDVDTVLLTNFISPAGNSAICAYTILSGDTNTFNDNICMAFFGIPSLDAVAVGIIDITEGCGLTTDTVKMKITNVGGYTINGNITASYSLEGLAPITEPVTDSIPVGDTIIFAFSQLVNLSANIYDTILDIKAWVTLTGDNVAYNDSVLTDVESLHTPPAPIVITPVTVPYASPATLTASSSTGDTLIWYTNSIGGTEVNGGTSFLTPFLNYVDTTFWVEAQGGAAGGLNIIGNGTVTQSYAPAYGLWDFGWSSMIYEASEILNAGLIDSVSFQMNASVSNHLMINQKFYMAHTTMSSHPNTNYPSVAGKTKVYDGNIIWNGVGWFTIVLDVPFNYNGVDNLLFYWENHDGDWVSGYPLWTSTAAPGKTIYKYADDNFPAIAGTVLANRPNIKFFAKPTGCPSARVPVDIIVTGQSTCDVGAYELVEPVSSIYMSSAETIKVELRNHGTLAQSNIPVSYQINGGTIITDTVFATIPPNDSLVFTFGTTADLSIAGNQYNFKLFTSLACDTVQVNDTIVRTIQNLVPNYCVSTATSGLYHDIENVTFGGINNTSPAPFSAMYTDYTNTPSGLIAPGTSYPISIKLNSASTFGYPGIVEVYIDYNRDGVYTEPSEIAFSYSYASVSSSTPLTINGNIVVPVGALNGLTQMRIVAYRSAASAAVVVPCGTYYTGETEDYTVMIAPRIPEDAGIEAVLNPTTISSIGTTPLEVRVRNYGTLDITSVDITYILNTGALVTTNYTATTILAGDSVDVNLGNISLVSGLNTICVYTTLTVNDTNNFNDTLCVSTYLEATVSSPYYDDFETSNVWFNDTLNTQWELGIPTGTFIDSAYSGDNAWVTKLDTNYIGQVFSGGDFLYTPKILVTGFDSVYVSFWHKMDVDAGSTDRGLLQVSVDGDLYGPLGYYQAPKGTKWYNKDASGIGYWNYQGQQWQKSEYTIVLNDLTLPYYLADTLQFKFVYMGDGSTTKEGWAIDNFALELPIVPLDAGVTSVDVPGTSTAIGDTIIVKVTVKNLGSTTLSSLPVSYKIGNGIPVTEIFTPTTPLALGDFAQYTFTQTYIAGTTDYQFCAYTSLAFDQHPTNDGPCFTITADLANYDVGCVIDWPTASVNTNLQYQAYVYVSITNHGMNAVTSIPLEYRVNNSVTVVNETWTGNLAPGQTVQYMFTQPYSSILGTYSLCAETKLANDGNASNNESCESIVGVAVGIEDVTDENFTVKQNQPNPATHNYSIEYNVPVPGNIHFELRNSLGQLVMVYEEPANVGENKLQLDASNLNSGVYFYSITFKGVRKTLRMVVTK